MSASTQQHPTPPENAATKILPGLRELVVLVPFFLLDALLYVWLKRHFHTTLPMTSVTAALGVFLAAWKFLPEDIIKSTRVAFADLLTSRRLARALWSVLVLSLLLTAFIGTIHIDNESEQSARLYLIDTSTEEAENGSTPDSARVDKHRRHAHFLKFVLPTGRQFQVQSNTQLRSGKLKIWPWSAITLAYPEDFEGSVVLGILLAGNFFSEPAGSYPLRIELTDFAAKTVLAEDTVTATHSLLASTTRPSPVDSAIRGRWLRQAATRYEVDTSEVVAIVNDWTRPRWARTKRALNSGERLRLHVTTAAGDTLANTIITANPPYDAFIDRR